MKQELETVTARYQELYNSKYYKEQELYNEQAGKNQNREIHIMAHLQYQMDPKMAHQSCKTTGG